MSDVEEKKSGYRLEYAKNNRAKCKGSFLSQLLVSSIAFSSLYASCDFRAETLQRSVIAFFFLPMT
jgi:hypothetical protein